MEADGQELLASYSISIPYGLKVPLSKETVRMNIREASNG